MPEMQTIKNMGLDDLAKRTGVGIVQDAPNDPDFGLELTEKVKKRLQNKPRKIIDFERIKKKYC